jgi:hypothetical protein
MNKRVKELAEQAGYKPLPGFDFANSLQEVFLSKFAKLIVRECIRCCGEVDIIQKHYLKNHLDMQLGAEQCIEIIKKHFGIEE